MITRNRIIVLSILALTMATAVWSHLRHVEESDHEPQRIPLHEHPTFRKEPMGGS